MLLLSFVSHAKAGTNENSFNFGYEAQLYRSEIQPKIFHILSIGADYSKLDQDSEIKIDFDFSASAEHINVWAIRSQNFFWSPRSVTPRTKTETWKSLFTLGKRERTWNEMDSLWNLSQIQPIDQWDRFRATQQGLLGAFYDLKGDSVDFHFFGSYLMYPENIPNVIIEGGRFLPYHPQAISSPPQTVTILNQTRPIYYEIEYPNIGEVLFRPSLMGSIESNPKKQLLFRLLYAYKPQNYFDYAIRGMLSIPNNAVQVYIKPRILSHQVIAGDVGYRFYQGTFQMGLSGSAILPDKETLSTDYTYAPVKASYLVSPWLKLETREQTTSLSFLSWNGGVDTDVGQYATPGRSVLSSHVFFRNASQVKSKLKLPFINMESTIEGKWVHEFSLSGDWISADLRMPFKTDLGKFYWVIGGDIIQTASDFTSSPGGEFLIDMKAQDRVRIGVQIAI